MSSPNQRKIIIQRDDKRTKSYFQIPTPNLQEAMYNLKGNSFKLYCYLCNNQNNYLLDLYPCDFCNVANVSNDTYRSAFKELEEKGYLVKHADSKTTYYFNEKGEEVQKVPNTYDLIETVDKETYNEGYQRALEKWRQERENK